MVGLVPFLPARTLEIKNQRGPPGPRCLLAQLTAGFKKRLAGANSLPVRPRFHECSLVKQYQALLATEGVNMNITPEGVRRLAQIAFEVNERTENIGARRLATVMERLLDELSFDAPNLGGQEVLIDEAAVNQRLGDLAKDEDLSRYIL